MYNKTPRIRNSDYIEWIRGLPCIACLVLNGSIPSGEFISDPHHVERKHGAAKGLKADDTRAIPLCHTHHCQLHSKGRETFADTYNIDYELVISRLNKIWEGMYGSLDKVRHRED